MSSTSSPGAAAGTRPAGVEDAKQAASDAATEAKEQVKAVASTARSELQRFTVQARDELGARAGEQGDRLAGALRTFSDQLTALAQGRHGEAGGLPDYVNELESKVRGVADRLTDGGPQGVMNDVTAFARRRPGLFLLGAIGAGFAVGRLVRSGAEEHGDDSTTAMATSPAYRQPSAQLEADPYHTNPQPSRAVGP